MTRAKLPVCVLHRFPFSSRVHEGSPVKSPLKLFENSKVFKFAEKGVEYHSSRGRLHHRRAKCFVPALRSSTLCVQTRLRLESHVENT